jgi:hypothetical protein
MRLVVGALVVLILGAIGGVAFWPGLITALDELVLLLSIDEFGADAAGQLFTPAVAYAVTAAATFVVFFVAVQKLTGDR